jgi:hypothetical protein
MSTPTRRGAFAAAASSTALLALLPATGDARLVTFGSSLKATASVAEARPVDTAYWNRTLAGGRKTLAPVRGQVRSIKVKGIALSNPKAGVAGGETMFHLQALRKRADGSFKILRTSGAFFLPEKGANPQKITTYRPVNFCVGKGEVLVFNTVGGFGGPGPFANGTPLQIFARVAGSNVSQFTAGGKTNNGNIIRARNGLGRGEELLMQATIGTGADGTGLCPGGTGR